MSCGAARSSARRIAAIVLLWPLAGLPAPAQEAPLPELAAFLAKAKARLQTNDALQSRYTYVERRVEQTLDTHGRVTGERVKVVESYPGLPGEPRWERLIEEDGRAVPASALAKTDAERPRRAEAYARRLASRPQQEYANARRAYEKARREFDEVIEDIFRVFEVRMEGRDTIEGHGVIVLALTPKPGARPATREGRQMRHFRVRAWVSESDYELVQLEADAIQTLSFGFGLLARIHEGAQFSFLRRKVNGEVWLPARSSYAGQARVGLVRMLRRRGVSEFSNYRRFSVDTSATFAATP